jgi:hypothetical protein
VICLNGERANYVTAVTHIQKLYKEGKLTNWRIFDSKNKVPVFVTFMPYRNLYSTLQTIKLDIDKLKSGMATKSGIDKLKSDMATKSDMAKLESELESEMAKLSTKWDIYMVMVTVIVGLSVLQMSNKRG